MNSNQQALNNWLKSTETMANSLVKQMQDAMNNLPQEQAIKVAEAMKNAVPKMDDALVGLQKTLKDLENVNKSH
jgi:hypothetical protein